MQKRDQGWNLACTYPLCVTATSTTLDCMFSYQTAWCASYCIRAEVGMHAPVMLTATRNNCMFSYQPVPGLPAVAAARLGFGWPYGGAGHRAVKCCIPLGSWLTCEESWPANRYNEQCHSDIALNSKTKLFKEANKCIQKHNTDFFLSNF